MSAAIGETDGEKVLDSRRVDDNPAALMKMAKQRLQSQENETHAAVG